ncbi:MAG: betaine--homocysteine S-methyltransferase [Aestuariivita sp.]|nr:betaine--homocysteine S-methyltransferase [Aestuariivita sp.]MCY4201783.1 betaine--homocysteine S-methyltransferase [Aestuariivita sp.]
MTDALSKMLIDKEVILADGATGTNLFNMGLSSGDAPELWNETSTKKVTKLYQDNIDAGSDLFLTNTFGGNAARLKLHDAQNQVRKLNHLGAELAREVADKCDRQIVVAGSVGPTGEIMEPIGTLSHALAVEMFHEQADGLKEGGVDIAWLETISAPEEYSAAAEAFERANLPWVGTMSFDTAGRTMMGVTTVAMAKLVDDLPNPPLAFGANCGTGAADLLRTILSFDTLDNSRPIIAKGNAGIPRYVDGSIVYDGSPELMADYAEMARNAGARIIGGCCGTTPAHLTMMRTALDTRPRASRPDLSEIVNRIGEFSSDSDGTDNTSVPSRARRRQR